MCHECACTDHSCCAEAPGRRAKPPATPAVEGLWSQSELAHLCAAEGAATGSIHINTCTRIEDEQAHANGSLHHKSLGPLLTNPNFDIL